MAVNVNHSTAGTSANNGNMEGNMKEIIYWLKGAQKMKKVKVPFEDANYTLDGDKDVLRLKIDSAVKNAQCRATLQLFMM